MTRQTNIHPSSAITVSPTAYSAKIYITTHNNERLNITEIVSDFSVVESLYRIAITCNITIMDATDFFRKKQISGQEVIEIQWERNKIGTKETEFIKRFFRVVDIPIFGKAQDHSQVYSFNCVSIHAYKNNFTSVSRTISGTATEIISNILAIDLGVPPSQIQTTNRTSSNHKIIVPNLRPLNAINWIIRSIGDNEYSPLFVYETLGGKKMDTLSKIYIMSQKDIEDTNNSVYRTYEKGTFFEASTQTQEDFDERQRRILDISSDLNMSKFISASEGAYASRTHSLDLAKKKYIFRDFSYSSSFSRMYRNGNQNISPSMKVGGDVISNLPLSSQSFVSLNSLTFDGDVFNFHGDRDMREPIIKSYQANMDNISHQMVVAGDYNLQSGVRLSIKIPRSIYTAGRTTDESVSGEFIVIGVMHKFDNEDGYTCDIKLKRSTSSIEWNKETKQ